MPAHLSLWVLTCFYFFSIMVGRTRRFAKHIQWTIESQFCSDMLRTHHGYKRNKLSHLAPSGPQTGQHSPLQDVIDQSQIWFEKTDDRPRLTLSPAQLWPGLIMFSDMRTRFSIGFMQHLRIYVVYEYCVAGSLTGVLIFERCLEVNSSLAFTVCSREWSGHTTPDTMTVVPYLLEHTIYMCHRMLWSSRNHTENQA